MPRSKSDQHLDQRSSSLLVSGPPIPIILTSAIQMQADGDLRSHPLDRDLLHSCGWRSDVRVSTEHLQGQDAALHNRHWRLASIPRLPSEMEIRGLFLRRYLGASAVRQNDGRVALYVSAQPLVISCIWNTTSNLKPLLPVGTRFGPWAVEIMAAIAIPFPLSLPTVLFKH